MTPNASSRAHRSKLPKLIQAYYAHLEEFAIQQVSFEMGTRPAFQTLLTEAGREHGWTLIPEQERKVNGKTIRPDGTLKDGMNLVRGYWEAKDTDDHLEAEIEKKRKAGYPLTNTLFEDNATAILYQNGLRVMAIDMRDPSKLVEILSEFFRYTESDIEEFEQAIEEFKDRVPDLAEGLANKIEQAHQINPAFKKAFSDFFELCRVSLNPDLAQEAVDEMLIQHILTERLIREIFSNPEFVRRNAIAAEIEKVMLAMTSQSFDRNTYLKELDRFYIAIEHAARTMSDFTDKQHFLNTVYERFFQGYSVKLADTMGIVYTPQEIVNFMCASVVEVLEQEFGKKLWDEDVCIIDPCTGTGNFIVNLIRRIPKAKLPDVYKHRLFANEIMLLPYYIAALNIEHAYYEQTGRYEPFEGLCFVDTLDMAERSHGKMFFMTAKNTERVRRQKRAPITIVIGNPPYNIGQARENDNNKNRVYPFVDTRIRETFSLSSRATNKRALSDAYVKFFRWAIDRLGRRDGIVCFISNNNFVDQLALDGFRHHLHQEFSRIYHLDLNGNVRRNPKLSGTTHNVFKIQVGVGITVAVKRAGLRKTTDKLRYFQVEETWRREQKLEWLESRKNIGKIEWEHLTPDTRSNWIQKGKGKDYEGLIPLGSKEAKVGEEDTGRVVFRLFSNGVKSNRDRIVYDFSKESLAQRIDEFIDAYNIEVDRWKRAPKGAKVDSYVRYDKVVWDADLKLNLQRHRYAEFSTDFIHRSLYRPFNVRWWYGDRILNARVYGMLASFPNNEANKENKIISVPGIGNRKEFGALISNTIVPLDLAFEKAQCFPFYTYDEDSSHRKENITDWALNKFRSHYQDKKITKWTIFYYVYGILHHPGYREKFADNLKRELPRIPFATDFWAFSKAGRKLAGLHLDYETLKPWDLEFIETPGEPLSYRVDDKMRLSKDKTSLSVNKSLTVAGIPAETFEYRLGNRSALEWVIDQYQVSTDKRSGIVSDPNRPEDPGYIVRLVGQVIHVSIETMKIVKGLPDEYSGSEPPPNGEVFSSRQSEISKAKPLRKKLAQQCGAYWDLPHSLLFPRR